MKLLTYATKMEDLVEGVEEVILSCSNLSRFSENSLEELLVLHEECKKRKIKTLLEWDILMQEEDFCSSRKIIEDLPCELKSEIRVNDPGACQYIVTSLKESKIHLNLEVGNHNLKALEAWVNYLGSQLKRVILSIELPKEKIETYIKSYPDLEFEILGLGRILLFYTPRKLLSIYSKKVHDKPIEVRASSEESPHKGFPVVENKHGTFMFNTRDFSLLKYSDELKDLGLDYFRIDNRFFSGEFRLDLSYLEKVWPAKNHSGFYRINKTDVLFKKLKNKHLDRSDESYLGEILGNKKASYLGLQLQNKKLKLKKGDRIFLRSPEGKEKEVDLKWLKDASGIELEESKAPHVVLIPAYSGFCARSLVFSRSKEYANKS